MEKTTLKAYGKINIVLDITGKRDDGYHLLNTVMQTVNLFDEIALSKRKKGIMVQVDKPFLPADERNLAFKAAKLVKEIFRLKEGVLIDIRKQIPVGGGMAGGSTDAAAVIHGLDRLFDLKMTMQQKEEIAVQIGADVPFCLHKGLFRAEGIGEKLSMLPPLPDLAVVLCAPAFSVSTAEAFAAFDSCEEPYHPDAEGFLEALRSKETEKIFSYMGNSLEPVVEKMHPQIGVIREKLNAAGAQRALMSGSGSTVFGLFDNSSAAENAVKELKNLLPQTEVYMTEFVKS